MKIITSYSSFCTSAIPFSTYKYLKFPTLINRWKNNSLSNFLCKLVIDKQLISKAKQQNCYGSKNRENI